MSKYIIEFIGTFFLVITIGLSGNPIAIGAVLAAMVYMGGYISGAHFNPAVTLGMLVIGKIKPLRAFLYLVMQLLGAWVGFGLTYYFIKYWPSFSSPTNPPAFWAEFTGGFIVVFTITRVVTEEISAAMGSFMIGAAFILAITIANPVSGGVLNPAIAINLHLFQASHILGPILGGIVAAPLALWFFGAKRAKR